MREREYEVELEESAWQAALSTSGIAIDLVKEQCSGLVGRTVLFHLDRYMKHQACVAAAAGTPSTAIAPPIWFSTDDNDDADGQGAQLEELHLAAAGTAQQQETCCIAGVRFLRHCRPRTSSPASLAGVCTAQAAAAAHAEQQSTAAPAGHQLPAEAAAPACSPADCFIRMVLSKSSKLPTAARQDKGGSTHGALQCVVDVYPAVEYADFLAVVRDQDAVAAQQEPQHQPSNPQRLQLKQEEPFIGAAAATADVDSTTPAGSPQQRTSSPQPSKVLEPQAAASAAVAATVAAAKGADGRKRRPRVVGKRNNDFDYDVGMDEEPCVMRAGGQPVKRRCGDAGGCKVPETMTARRLKLKNDWNDHFCHECLNFRDGTAVECDGTCLRMFHMQCLPLHLRPKATDNPNAPWYCEDCRKGVAECAVCGEKGAAASEVYKCSMGSCGRYYHPACLLKVRGHLRFKVAPTSDTVKMLKAQAAAAAAGKTAPDDTTGSTAAAAAADKTAPGRAIGGTAKAAGDSESGGLMGSGLACSDEPAAAATAAAGVGGLRGRGSRGGRGRGSSSSRGGARGRGRGRGRRSSTAEEMASGWTSSEAEESERDQLTGSLGRKRGRGRGRGGRGRGRGRYSFILAYGSSDDLLLLQDAATASCQAVVKDEGCVVKTEHMHIADALFSPQQQQQQQFGSMLQQQQQQQQCIAQSPAKPVDPKRQRSRHYQGPFLTASAAAGVPDDVPFTADEVLQGRVTCPSHYCQSCHLSGDSLKLLRCWTCPRAYHTSCLHDLATKFDLGGHKMVDCPWCKVAFKKAERQWQQQQLATSAAWQTCNSSISTEPFPLTRLEDPAAAAATAGGGSSSSSSKKQQRPDGWTAAYIFAAAREALRDPQSVDLSELKGQPAVVRTKPGSRIPPMPAAAAAARGRGGGRGRGRGGRAWETEKQQEGGELTDDVGDGSSAHGAAAAAAAAAAARADGRPARSSAAAAAAFISKTADVLLGRSMNSSSCWLDMDMENDTTTGQDTAGQQQQHDQGADRTAAAAAAGMDTQVADTELLVKEDPDSAAAAAAWTTAAAAAADGTRAVKRYVRIVPVSSDGVGAAAHASAPGIAPNAPVDLVGKSHWHFGTHYKGGGVEFQVPVPGIKLHSKLVVHEDGGVTLRPMHTPARATPPLLNGKALTDKGVCYELSHGDVIDIGGAKFLVEWHDLAARVVPNPAAAAAQAAAASQSEKQPVGADAKKRPEAAAAAGLVEEAAGAAAGGRAGGRAASAEDLGPAAAELKADSILKAAVGLGLDHALQAAAAAAAEGVVDEDPAAAAARVYAAVEAHLQAMAAELSPAAATAAPPVTEMVADVQPTAAAAATAAAAEEDNIDTAATHVCQQAAAAAARCCSKLPPAALEVVALSREGQQLQVPGGVEGEQHETFKECDEPIGGGGIPTPDANQQMVGELPTPDANNAAAGSNEAVAAAALMDDISAAAVQLGGVAAAAAVTEHHHQQQQQQEEDGDQELLAVQPAAVVLERTTSDYPEPAPAAVGMMIDTTVATNQQQTKGDHTVSATIDAEQRQTSPPAAAAASTAAAAAGAGTFRPAHRSRKQKVALGANTPEPTTAQERLSSPAKKQKHSHRQQQQQQERASSISRVASTSALEDHVSSTSNPAAASATAAAAMAAAAGSDMKRTRRTKRLCEVVPWGRQQVRSERKKPSLHVAHATAHAALEAAGIPLAAAAAAAAACTSSSSGGMPARQQQQQWWGAPPRKQQQEKTNNTDNSTVLHDHMRTSDTEAASMAAAAAAAARCMPHLGQHELIELAQKLLAGKAAAAAAAAPLPVQHIRDAVSGAAASCSPRLGPRVRAGNGPVPVTDGIGQLRSIAKQPNDMLARFLKPQRQQQLPLQQQQQQPILQPASSKDALSTAIAMLTAVMQQQQQQQQQSCCSLLQHDPIKQALSLAIDVVTAAVRQQQQQQQPHPSNEALAKLVDGLIAILQQQQQQQQHEIPGMAAAVSSGDGFSAAPVEGLTAALTVLASKAAAAAPPPAAAVAGDLAEILSRQGFAGRPGGEVPAAQTNQTTGLVAMLQRFLPQQQQQRDVVPMPSLSPQPHGGLPVADDALAAAAAAAAAQPWSQQQQHSVTSTTGAANANELAIPAQGQSATPQHLDGALNLYELPPGLAGLAKLLNPSGSAHLRFSAAAAAAGGGGGGDGGGGAGGAAPAQGSVAAGVMDGLRQELQALATAKGLPFKFT